LANDPAAQAGGGVVSVFKTALRLIIRRPSLPLVHLVALGLIGVLMVAGSMSDSSGGEITEVKPTVAVIDHDGSALSRALTAQLASKGEPIQIGQTKRALQDAAANGDAAYIAVIPAGYESEFLAARGGPPPVFETVATLESAQSRYMDQVANTFLRLVRAELAAPGGAELDRALADAARLADLQVDQSVVDKPASGADTERFGAYLGYTAYPLTAGVLVLTGLMFHLFHSGEVRRRNLASPVPPPAMAGALTAAGVVVCLVAWLWVGLLSFAPPGGGLAVLSAAPGRFALAMAAALVYTSVPLALGFLAGQLGLGTAALNGLGTILGLAFAFLGGSFTVGLEPSGPMAAIGPFVPSHWHMQAVQEAVGMANFTWHSYAPYLGALAMELLFAAVFAALGLLAGRLRAQRDVSAGVASG
jgi:ABC-2 type transport system permease protein